jgi:type IV secretory pathway VirB4 component
MDILPMETNRINNRNKFVLGPSGSGKSFFMNHLVRQYYLHDTDIVLVDTGHSYSGLCSYYKGKYITYSENKPITMNPFRINEAEYNEEKREFLKALIGLLWKGADGHLNQVEDSVLMSTIPAYYKQFLFNDNKLKRMKMPKILRGVSLIKSY